MENSECGPSSQLKMLSSKLLALIRDGIPIGPIVPEISPHVSKKIENHCRRQFGPFQSQTHKTQNMQKTGVAKKTEKMIDTYCLQSPTDSNQEFQYPIPSCEVSKLAITLY